MAIRCPGGRWDMLLHQGMTGGQAASTKHDNPYLLFAALVEELSPVLVPLGEGLNAKEGNNMLLLQFFALPFQLHPLPFPAEVFTGHCAHVSPENSEKSCWDVIIMTQQGVHKMHVCMKTTVLFIDALASMNRIAS